MDVRRAVRTTTHLRDLIENDRATQGHLSRIEHGVILPGLETLAAIARVFEISLPRLVSGIVEDRRTAYASIRKLFRHPDRSVAKWRDLRYASPNNFLRCHRTHLFHPKRSRGSLIVKEGYEKLNHQSRTGRELVLRQVKCSHSEVLVATRVSLGFHHAAYLFMAKQQPARFLIIAAHGVQAVGKPPFSPDGRAFHFYGPLGSTITVPPIEDVLKQERTYDEISRKKLSPAYAYEIVETDMVENYEIAKYAGSQNKLGITYADFHADLDVHDPEGEFHVFSVSRRFKGAFGMGDMLLSKAVTLAESWNKLKYERVYCMFCRGVPGRPRKTRDPGHTYLDNREADVKLR